MLSIVRQHLRSLVEFCSFFPEEGHKHGNMLKIDGFATNIEDSNLSINEKSVIGLFGDDSFNANFQSPLSKPHFWLYKKYLPMT